jgi:cytochrome c-type biogenesis protein CcmH/NrfG
MRPDVDTDVVKLLIQVGLLAAWERMFDDAEIILAGAESYRPDLPHIGYGRALMHHTQGRSAEAIDVLRNHVLRAHPNNMMATSLLGFLLQQTGQAGWQALLDRVVEDGTDGPAVDLARQVLGGQNETASSAVRPAVPLHAVRG